MTPADLTTESIRIGDMVVCSLTGDVLLHNQPEFERALAAALSEKPAVLAVDLARVVLFTCAGLNVLLDVRLRAPAQGTALVLLQPSRTVRRLLELTDTETLFPVLAAVDARSWELRGSSPSGVPVADLVGISPPTGCAPAARPAIPPGRT
ncbi:STAS domain-containing protein [Streptomyces sp. NRRL S-350]|uniref:STAS domain-containing protein n=1 Tax=Streptomyces sp. NRRL S-350 TaxID=1463902 RepID=UPI00131B6967|nr:STAS domain-containing protein [Streptomyces sp. NRRL S-350]